ncbi:DUF2235 domain-containing protein [Stenotrophomonas maltophilia]|nr:DUF2235 domain-containing protein [Stenotrophomonas maltophilia]
MTKLNRRELARNAGAIFGSFSECGVELFIGCLFDGTRNHRLNSHRLGNKTESNIARLFGIFDRDQSRSPSRRAVRFASYIQGVGAEALKEIGDTGTGWHARAGAAAGWGGEGRVNWMLMQVQDHLLDHFAGTTVTKAMGFDSTVPIARKMNAFPADLDGANCKQASYLSISRSRGCI